MTYLLSNTTILSPIARSWAPEGNGCSIQLCGPSLTHFNGTQSLSASAARDVFVDKSRLFYDAATKDRTPRLDPVCMRQSPKKVSNRAAMKLTTRIFDKDRRVAESRPRAHVSRRTRSLAPMIKLIMKRHASTNYALLLDKYCPCTQDDREHAQTYRHWIAQHTDRHHVSRYARSAIGSLLPAFVTGSLHNRKVLLAGVNRFVRLSLYERINTKELLSGFRLGDCEWLKYGTKGAQHHPCTDELRKRTQVLRSFVTWLFEEPLVNILRSAFYVTESAPHRNRVFYFRKNIWEHIVALNHDSKIVRDFEQLSADEITALLPQDASTNAPALGLSSMRMLPKLKGGRMIINLGSKYGSRSKASLFKAKAKSKLQSYLGDSINSKLVNLFEVLKFESGRNTNILGASTSGNDEVYLGLRDFIISNACRSSYSPSSPFARGKRFYVASVDIEGCFDSIPQDKIFGLIRRILRERDYTVRKYCTSTFTRRAQRVRIDYKRNVTPAGTMTHFGDVARAMATTKCKNVVLADLASFSHHNRNDLKELLKSHLTENLVRMGKNVYRQKHGIPQGSILSTLLCNYFYGDLENRVILPKLCRDDHPEPLLMRRVDDFLLVTSERYIAVEFLRIMHTGFPDYNCYVNTSKSKVNFELSYAELEALGSKPTMQLRKFSWCGLTLDTISFDITNDYSKLVGNYVGDTITPEVSSKPGNYLGDKLVDYIKPVCHPIFLDAFMNSPRTIKINVYQAFVLSAMKYHAHSQTMPQGVGVSLAIRCVSGCVGTFHSIAKSRLARVIFSNSEGSEARLGINEREVRWLGLHAFHETLKRKQAAHCGLLKELTGLLRESKAGLELHGVGDSYQHCLEAARESWDGQISAILY